MKNKFFKSSFYEKLKLLLIPIGLLIGSVATQMWGATTTFYFDNSVTSWSNVYLYLYSKNYWESNGSGSESGKGCYASCMQMSLVSGSSTIYKYTYTGNEPAYVCFLNASQNNYGNFWDGTAGNVRGAYKQFTSNTTTLYTPTSTYEQKNNVYYYNSGSWSTYYPDLYLGGDNSWISKDWNTKDNDNKFSRSSGTYTKTISNVSASTDHKMKIAAYNWGQPQYGSTAYNSSGSKNINSKSADNDGNKVFQTYVAGDVIITLDYSAGTFTLYGPRTITLNNYSATTAGTESVAATYGAATCNITCPEKTGYTFNGYYTSADGGGMKVINADGSWVATVSNYTSSGKYAATANQTLHAYWTSNSTYTLTYHANWYIRDTSGDVPPAQVVAKDGTATVADRNTLAMTNYTFSGWNTSPYSTGTSYAVGSSITMDEDKDLYAVWTRSIPLNQNGATINGTTSVTGTYNCDTLPSITNPQKTGYTFVGWRTANDGTGNLVIDTDGHLQSDVYHWTDQITHSNKFQRYPTSTSPLYATWSAKQYNITLDKKEGSSGGTAKVKYDATSLTNIYAPSRTGYSVEGYYGETGRTNKVADASGNLQSSVTGFTTGNVWKKDADGTITLYTNWTPNPYTITFDPNGGTVDPTSASVTYDAAISNAPVPTKPGYNFTGYNTAGSVSITTNTGVFKANVSTFTDASAHWIKDADATITAQWTPKQTNVTLDQQSGSGGSGSVTATYGSSMPAATMPTYTGYDFDGYYTSTGGGGTKYYNANGSSAKNWNFEDATKTLYAKWTVHNYTITYNLDGGDNSGSNPDTYTIEDALITLQDPSKTGYDFAGWYTNSEKTIPGNTIAAGSHENKTFYAKWTVKNYNITYSPVSAPSGVAYTTTPANANYGSTVTMVITPESGKTIDVSAVDGSSNSVSITNSSANTYTFTMPASAVTVSVAVVTLPIVYVLKSKGTNACFPFGFTSGGSASQVKLWAWSTADGTPNFYTSNGEFPGNATAESKATEITDAHGNTWWRFMPNNTSYFDRSTEFSLIVYSTSSSQRIYESNANDHYVSDGLTRTTCNASTNYKFTGTVWVVPGGTSAHSATLYYENPSSPKKFVFVEGRFKAYTDKTRQTELYTGPNDGTKWADESRNIRMLYDETNSRYYLHTYCTPAELKTISNNNGFFNLHTSTVVTGFSGDSRYYLNTSGQNLNNAGQKRSFTSTNSGHRPYINNDTTDMYVVLYWDESKIWYEKEPIPAAITSIGLSSSRVPPMATITATPNMASKRNVDQAYCWGVYTDAACTSKVNGISFSSLGDGKVQFTVPQTAGTYYLKLTVRASATCNASIDDEASVSFQVTTDNMVFFNNTSTQWSGVYVYFLGGTSYWDSNLGSGCKDRDGGQANQMNRIGKSDIYYFDYTGHATGLGSEDTVYVAFTEIGKPKAANFYYVNAAYRGDFSACAPMYVPEGGWITDYKNSCQYYNRGYWTTYGVSGQNRGAGFTLHVYDGVVTGSQIEGGEHILSNTDGSNTYKATVTLPSRNYTYGFKLESCGHIWYGNGGTMTAHNSTAWPQYTGTNNCGVSSMAAGEYTFIVQCADDGNLKVSVEYPLMDGDYRLIYNDTCSYQTGWHPSQFIRNSQGTSQLDTVAMYIRPGKQPVLKIQVCDDASANPPTWRDSATYDVSGLTDGNRVYNFYISQAAGKLTINSTSPYTGLYYVRAHGLGGGWTNYKTDKDNRMTYTEYAEEKNYGFNYYKAHWYGATGVNVTYTVACDYSESLCDTLVADAGNNPLTAAEARSLPHTASIRFGWDSKTNTLKRAYINGSSNVSDRYLVMKGVNSKIFTSDGEGVKNDNALNDYEYKFADLNNWIYQADVKARCGATALLTAKYDNHVQDFIGTSSPVEKGDTILSGSDDGSTKYAVRVIYDFKTNRLLCAWLADGTTITEDKAINADVMIVRQHHEDAAQISFSNSAKLTDVKTVYGVLQLKKDTMTNTTKSVYRRGLYWISFPFDVKLSEVFGLGEYGTHWMLEYYDGAARAREGFWAESDGFWKFVSVAQRKDFVMKANVGYVIGLDVDLLQDGGSDVWANNTQEASLYFPSASAVSTIDGTLPSGGTYTVPSHECSITRDDRNIKDSHWNIIGVPSYANVTGNNVVEEVTIGGNTLPFLYKHNMNDNSIEVVGADDDFTFRAMHAYYVQYAGTIDWTVRDPFPTSGLTARRNGNADKDVYSLKLTIRDEEETQSDRALIRLTDEASASFELSKDLAKAFNRGKVNLYTLIDGVEAAGNNLPLVAGGVTYIPVGVKTYGGGTYTISLPEGTDDLEVYLLDQATGARTNLAVSGYEVVLPNGVTDDRFMLEIGRNNAPTAVESVDAEGKKVVKFIENDMLYILKDGNIYDARGARVK